MSELNRTEKEGSNTHQWRSGVDYRLNRAKGILSTTISINRVSGLAAIVTSTLVGAVGHPEMFAGTGGGSSLNFV